MLVGVTVTCDVDWQISSGRSVRVESARSLVVLLLVVGMRGQVELLQCKRVLRRGVEGAHVKPKYLMHSL